MNSILDRKKLIYFLLCPFYFMVRDSFIYLHRTITFIVFILNLWDYIHLIYLGFCSFSIDLWNFVFISLKLCQPIDRRLTIPKKTYL